MCNVPSGNFPKIRLANGIWGAERCAIGKLHSWESATWKAASWEKPLGNYLPSFIDENRKKLKKTYGVNFANILD